ncbi:M23 family metallopeptidase [Paenibacillus glycinis]|uniref:Peptidoglycan DD-metalloendopeptidase family protein n=1 Tax=Paenibacillus glycinis TaxID=2697035 RepID=A0ABW9XTD1_9BACL|nr:M23 family metallopeptidase [Paenibacillus glycinis]NBD25918.1 peptidoglycan DD-metalloendopeptidase family protein [Paenibacillus glycinis]
MDTRNSVRERRQERIRRIMENNAKQAARQQPQTSQPQPLRHPQRQQAEQEPMLLVPPHADRYPAGLDVPPAASGSRPQEEDPERLWKANPNPWESAGWNMAPLPSKDVRASKAGGPPPDRPNDYRFIARGLFIQSAVAMALFAIVFLMFKVDNPAAKKGQEAVTAALTESMNFDAAAAAYNKWFAGAPSFIPFFGSHGDEESRLAEGAVELPIVSPLRAGTVVRSFAETLDGVDIAGSPEQAVLAAETGRVILVSKDGNDGETVFVQHANERVTVYGHLTGVIVAANDWIEAGKTLGKLQAPKESGTQSLLFFAVKEKGRYVNPADVVPID